MGFFGGVAREIGREAVRKFFEIQNDKHVTNAGVDNPVEEGVVHSDPYPESLKSNSFFQKLNKAEKIVVKKSVASFGDKWSIKVDSKKSGKIRGKKLYLIGDTYTLFDDDGDVVASKKANYRIVNQTFTLYDSQEEEYGGIEQKFNPVFRNYRVIVDGKIIATAKEKLAQTLTFHIISKSGVKEYVLHKTLYSFGSEVTIERLVEKPTVSGLDAIWVAVLSSNDQDELRQKF